MGRTVSDAELQVLVDKVREVGSQRQAARELNMKRSTLRTRLQTAVSRGLISDIEASGENQTRPDVSVHYSGNTGYVEAITTVTTVEDALEKAQVDQLVWEADRFVVNAWQAPNGENAPTDLWQVKV